MTPHLYVPFTGSQNTACRLLKHGELRAQYGVFLSCFSEVIRNVTLFSRSTEWCPQPALPTDSSPIEESPAPGRWLDSKGQEWAYWECCSFPMLYSVGPDTLDSTPHLVWMSFTSTRKSSPIFLETSGPPGLSFVFILVVEAWVLKKKKKTTYIERWDHSQKVGTGPSWVADALQSQPGGARQE